MYLDGPQNGRVAGSIPSKPEDDKCVTLIPGGSVWSLDVLPCVSVFCCLCMWSCGTVDHRCLLKAGIGSGFHHILARV